MKKEIYEKPSLMMSYVETMEVIATSGTGTGTNELNYDYSKYDF